MHTQHSTLKEEKSLPSIAVRDCDNNIVIFLVFDYSFLQISSVTDAFLNKSRYLIKV